MNIGEHLQVSNILSTAAPYKQVTIPYLQIYRLSITFKTRTKVVHKRVSKCCDKARRIEIKRCGQSRNLYTNVTLCDIERI